MTRRGFGRRWLLLAAAVWLAVVVAGCSKSELTPLEPVGTNPFTALTVGTDSTLEVLTWNLRNFPINGETTVLYTIQAIEAIDPDVVALQEIQSRAWFRSVVEGLAGWNGMRGDGSSGDLDLAVLYKTDVVTVAEGGIYQIFEDDSRAFPRAPMVLDGVVAGRRVVVINNHLKASGDGAIDLNDPWDEETRRQDACRQLEQYIATTLAGERVIVVGDMNDQLTDPVGHNVFQNFLDAPDDFRFADMSIAEGSSYNWSYPTWPSHLDHIMITSPLFTAIGGAEATTETIRLDQHLRGGLARYLADISDHVPVVLRLKL